MEEFRNKVESKVEEVKKILVVGGIEIVENNVIKSRVFIVLFEQDLDIFFLGDLEDSDDVFGEILNLLFFYVLNLFLEIDFFVYCIILQMMVMVMVMEVQMMMILIRLVIL